MALHHNTFSNFFKLMKFVDLEIFFSCFMLSSCESLIDFMSVLGERWQKNNKTTQ